MEDLFRALASENRIRLLRLLRRRSLCVGAVAARLGMTQSAASQHLDVLRRAGLVVSDKRGCYVHYRLSDKALSLCEKAINDLFRLPGASASGETHVGLTAHEKGCNESMCDKSKTCERPKELVSKPEECSSEQVRKCHGDAGKHPCVVKKRRPKAD